MKLIGFLFAILLSASSAQAQGFRIIEKADLQIGVWYPSDSKAVPAKLGPFEAEYALNGVVREGKYPIALMSHGKGGHFRSHHLTAAALAKAGYIVIAPLHGSDHKLIGYDTAQGIQVRVNELQKALETALAETDLAKTADRDNIHGIGYSLGSLTVMMGKGAVFDLQNLENHCREHSAEDADFCLSGNLWKRIKRIVKRFFADDKAPLRQSTASFINGSVALVAPIGQGVEITKNFSSGKIFIAALEYDEILPVRFHAEPLAELLQHNAEMRHYAAHHFSFIGPFPQWLIEEEKDPVMLDGAGFDRKAFIDGINSDIVDFFHANN